MTNEEETKAWVGRIVEEREALLSSFKYMDAKVKSLQADLAKLHGLVNKVYTAKGRYHTQLAMCDLYDAVGLKNERPK